MTYDSIPLPHIDFTEIPEKEAEEINSIFFQANGTITTDVESTKRYIQDKLASQVNRDDKIVILSYLINKVSLKLHNLPIPTTDIAKGVQERETKPYYTAILHWLYRLIENEGIAIPRDLFTKDEIAKAQKLIEVSLNVFEEAKIEYPDKIEIINEVQDKLKATKKFLHLGKEKWSEIFITSLIKVALEKDLFPLIGKVIDAIKPYFITLITKVLGH